MNPVDIIQQLENTSSRLDKEAIIENAWKNNVFEFFDGAKLALDPWTTFGIKKVPSIEESDDDLDAFSYNDFKQLAKQLSSRSLTGNAARDAVITAAENSHISKWNSWYRRVLLKDLRCGVTETTINKVLKKIAKTDPIAKSYIIPTFDIQLAESAEINEISGLVYIDPKLDGMRILAFLDKEKNEVNLYTRSGHLNTNFNYIIDSLINLLPHIPISLVLDGEMVSASFNKLMTQVNRKKNVNTEDAKFALFDILPMTEFFQGKSIKTLRERHLILSSLEPLFQKECRFNNEPNVYVIPKIEIDLSTEDGRKRLIEFNKEVLAVKFEDIMVKLPDSVYECKRSKSWRKIKPFIEVTLRLDDMEVGTGRNSHRLGNFICSGVDMGVNIHSSVGGFTDDQREEFWAHKDELIGNLVEIQADGLSQNKDDPNIYSLRFPRFLRFRTINKGDNKL